MKKTVVLVLVLIVVFSSQLFSETRDCQQSFELGKVGAKEEHRVWAWYLLGIGIGIFDYPLLFYGESYVLAVSGLGFLVLHTATFIPAMLLPKRTNISPSFSDVELECYRYGYKVRARWKNISALLLGELTVVALFAVANGLGVFAY